MDKNLNEKTHLTGIEPQIDNMPNVTSVKHVTPIRVLRTAEGKLEI